MSYSRGENTDYSAKSILLDHFDNHRQTERQTERQADRQTDKDIEEETRVNRLYTRRLPLANFSP